MKIEKYAAIDIGSNAIRILIANVIINNSVNVVFFKNSLVRVPIRLGEDTFTSGNISNLNIKRMLKAIKSFKLLINIHEVIDYSVYATSALREAKNKSYVIKLIKEKTGVEIEIIDGEKEAKLISSSNLFKEIYKNSNVLYVDVGGGSTEFSIIQNGKRVIEKSFRIGTVRLLKGVVSDLLWIELKNWLVKNTKTFEKLTILGTGGSIGKIQKLTQENDNKPIDLKALQLLHQKVSLMTHSERIIKYQLNPDRADVILPALNIYIKTMEWSKISEIVVPKIGLSDGMIEEIYRSKNNLNF